jgi:DNA-binding transcriptional LysR family regulator
MQMKELEAEVGLALFDREGRSVTLTTTGEYFLAHARRVLAAMKDAEDTVARFKGLTGGQLTVGMVSTAQYFLPRLLARFRVEHPDIEITLRVGNREQLVALMQRNEVDLAIMGRPPREWATRAEPFAMHPHVLVTAPDHPFVGSERVNAAALSREAFIVREPGSGTRAALQEYLDEFRLHVRIVMEMNSNETIKQTVMAGLGVSVLSLHTVGMELRQGLIAAPEVEGLPLMRRWNVVNNHGKLLSPAAEALRYFILEHGEALLAQSMPVA